MSGPGGGSDTSASSCPFSTHYTAPLQYLKVYVEHEVYALNDFDIHICDVLHRLGVLSQNKLSLRLIFTRSGKI